MLTVLDVFGTLEPERYNAILRHASDDYGQEARESLKDVTLKLNKLAPRKK